MLSKKKQRQTYKAKHDLLYNHNALIGGITTLKDTIDSIIEKIPPTEKLFGYAWIISWFIGIWIYHLQLFITGIFCLFLAYGIFQRHENNQNHQFPVVFTMDKATKTLTVQHLYDTSLKWDKTEICSGKATLPQGPVNIGDTVKNCEGNVALRHIPTNTLFGAYNFTEK